MPKKNNSYINNDGKLNSDGKLKICEIFNVLNKFGLIIRSTGIYWINAKNKYTRVMHQDYVFERDKFDKPTKKLIAWKSGIDAKRNCLSVLTGELFGGYIGIDIDIKNGTPDAIKIFKNKINKNDAKNTLITQTPSGGLHYLFKMTDKQQKVLKNFTQGQLKLFNQDIDVIYNRGRFVVARFVWKYPDNKPYEYKIINYREPTILPRCIFDEICNKINPNITKTTFFIKNNNLKNESEGSSDNDRQCDNKEATNCDDSDHNSESEKTKDTSFNNLSDNNSESEKTSSDSTQINNINVFTLDKDWTKKDNQAYKYLICLKPHRYDERNMWFNVGAALYNNGCSYDLFDKWSNQSDKYNKRECEKLWKSFRNFTPGKNKQPITIRTLMKYASDDNHEGKYDELKKKKKIVVNKVSNLIDLFVADKNLINIYEKYVKDILECETITDTIIGRFVYNIYPDKYIYDRENIVWYECNDYGILYRDTVDLIDCKDKMEKEIVDILIACFSIYQNKCPANPVVTKNYCKLIMTFQTVSKKKIIIEQLKQQYAIKNFKKNVNNNKYLFAFDNGVYDMKTFEFRNAKKEELVLGTTGYEYRESDSECVNTIIKMIKDMFIGDELYEYFMTIISLRLVKINKLEEFYFMIGKAGNGKGLITSLIENTFGNFSQILSSSTFCESKNKVGSESPSPAIASTCNSNIVFVNELDENIKLASDIVKNMSGGDKIKTRLLKENCFEFIPGYALFFVSNFEPNVDGNDGGIQRRLRFIPFNVSFTDNPNPKKNEKKINRDLKELIKKNKYCCAFFDILVSFYKKYINNNKILVVPDIVKCKTTQLLTNKDPVKQFVESCLVITENDDDYIVASHMNNMFSNFRDENLLTYNINKLKQRLNDDFGIKSIKGRKNNGFIGVKEIIDDCDNSD
jgi:P4 family phage/plasmid primase-like protien